MDLNAIDRYPYFLDAFTENTREAPDSVMLVDDVERSGLTRAEADRISGQVYAWLTKQNIGRCSEYGKPEQH